MIDRTAEAQILEMEERLKSAMLGSNASALEELLAPELIFTDHFGQLLGKEDDLAAHRTGRLKVEGLNPSERHVLVYGDIGIVSVRTQVSGTYDGNAANGDFRFTRVWALSADKRWRVVAAHAGIVREL